MTFLQIAEFSLGATILALLIGALKWAFETRRDDMREVRKLSADDMSEVRRIRAEDMGIIRGSLNEIGSAVGSLNDKVALQNSRVGRIEAWKDEHAREDERAHAAIGVLEEKHEQIATNVAVLVERTERRSRNMVTASKRNRGER